MFVKRVAFLVGFYSLQCLMCFLC
uniref:Uncharacterized protein n=1 Tax=Anopheles arabiensis TaxID=7173 RepID=A0A182IGL4_ANOAR